LAACAARSDQHHRHDVWGAVKLAVYHDRAATSLAVDQLQRWRCASHGTQREIAVTQNLTDLVLSEAQLASVDNALFDLETQLAGLVAMTSTQRRKLTRMGDKSEAFCRQALSVLGQNPQVVPPSLNLAGAQSDLATLDQLRPRLQRLQRLAE